jgi:hypothetical protein
MTKIEITLSDDQKREIYAIIAAGSTISAAAKAIGLNPEQLQAHILTNAEMADKVRKAEQQAEIYFITKIREAAQKPHGWRAAAWWLERRRSQNYGNAKSEIITPDSLQIILDSFLKVIFKYIENEDIKEKILKDLTLLITNSR